MENRDAMQNEVHSLTRIVCIYAMSDELFYRKLRTHLSLWQREGDIEWLEISAGNDMEQTMHAHLRLADLVLLLISPDFFAEDLCYMVMKDALQERIRRKIPVVPTLARTSAWKRSACKNLQALPDNEQPIAEWNYPEQAYENIRVGLARFIPGFSTPELRSHIFQPRDLPRNYVPRSKVFDSIKSQLLSGSQTTAITTALRGAGGFGKTTLALALCHDAEVQAAFPDGILWVELGEHPSKSLDVMNGVLASLGPSRTVAITEEEARDRWRKVLSKRACLLVIDDVWQAAALSPLLEGGPHCVRLITTRNDQVLPEGATRLFVDAMKPEEAIAVLCQNLPEEIQQETYQPQLADLAQRSGYWPLLLTLAHGLLADQVHYGRSIASALEVVEHAYQHRGVTAFHLEQVSERHQTVERCLEVSLRHLEEFTLARYQAAMRYQELAIFPEDTDIPLATLHCFWQGTGNLETWEVDELCVRLHQLSLLLICDLGKGIIRLHDVMRSYLIHCVGSNLSALHARFLDVSKQVLGLSRWADLPSDENYLWQHLVLHLCSASRVEGLQSTLTDLLYLARKVLYVGVPALETDLLWASRFGQAKSVVSVQSFFESVYRTIVQISHLLQHVSTFAEVGGLLLSYLGSQSPFATSGAVFIRLLPRPFLTAWHPLPSRSSSALIRTLLGHTDSVPGCAVSPDSRLIVSASHDHTLKVWDAATGVEHLTLIGHAGEVNDCAVSPDGSYIVSASGDGTLKVWDAVTGTERLTLMGHTSRVLGCVVSPDGSYIVSASADHTLKVWDATTGAEHLTLTGHTDLVFGCAVSPDSRLIVSASHDHTLKVWDAATGVEHLTLIGHAREVNGCAVSPDGSYIVSASGDGTLKVWDAVTGTERLTLMGHASFVRDCAVSPDGSYIVSASWDDTLKVWDVPTGAERLTLTGHSDAVESCAVSPDGSYIVSTSDDHTLKVWDATTGAERLTLTGRANVVHGCTMSPDGHFIVSASWNRTLKVWDASTGVERLTLTGHTDTVESCAVSPDGSYIVSASGDGTLKVWDAATGLERLTLTGHAGPVLGCAVSPDGSYIVSVSADHTLKMWWGADAEVKCLTLTGHAGEVNGCAVSPNGSYIVSASNDHTLKVWDAATEVECLTLTGHTGEVNGCAVSPDGSYIVSASNDHTLKVWDAATGAERLTLIGHADVVLGCAVSPDGCFIISTSWDGALKVWGAQTGQCMLTFPMDGGLFGCAFHPDGEHLVACGMQGMYFWRLVV